MSYGDPPTSGLVSVLCSAVLHHSAAFTSFLGASLHPGWVRAGCFHCCSGVSSLSLLLGRSGKKLLLWRKLAERALGMGKSCYMLCPVWVRMPARRGLMPPPLSPETTMASLWRKGCDGDGHAVHSAFVLFMYSVSQSPCCHRRGRTHRLQMVSLC